MEKGALILLQYTERLSHIKDIILMFILYIHKNNSNKTV